MSTNYHTPWVDETSEYKPSHMNAPLSELDTQITVNVAAILLRLQVEDFVNDDADGQIVTDDADGEPVVDN